MKTAYMAIAITYRLMPYTAALFSLTLIDNSTINFKFIVI